MSTAPRKRIGLTYDGPCIVEEFLDCKSDYDVFKILKSIGNDNGFPYFNVMRLPRVDEKSMSEVTIVSNWDPELIRTYDAHGFLTVCPVVKKFQKSNVPIVWQHEKPQEKPKTIKCPPDLFVTYGITCSVYFPVADSKGVRGCVRFSGSRKAPAELEIRDLSYISNHLYNILSNLHDYNSTHSVSITDREIECLKWTASGKTSAEIAVILDLSENTVNHYLSTASHKLDTTNKTHTVAKAIRLGLLDL